MESERMERKQYEPFWVEEPDWLEPEDKAPEGVEDLLVKIAQPKIERVDWTNVEPMDRKELHRAIQEWAEKPEHRDKNAFRGCSRNDCFFHRTAYDSKEAGCCAYMAYMLDHPEHRPSNGSCMRGCLPGEGCIRFLKRDGNRPKPRPTSMVLPGSRPVIREPFLQRGFQFNERMAHDCYMAGMHDQQIADKLHVSRKAIQKWRMERGYPALKTVYISDNGRSYTFDVEKAMELYEQGLSDKQIGIQVNASQTCIYRWRHEEGLDTKQERVPPITEENRAKMREMYNRGMSDRAIAKVLGCAQKTVGGWRRKMGLKSNTDMRILDPTQKDRVFRELHEQGLPDRLIAEKTGYSVTTVANWRKKNDVKLNRVKSEKTEDETFLALYNEGLTDEELMKRLSCSNVTVRRLRSRYNLKMNRGPGEKK